MKKLIVNNNRVRVVQINLLQLSPMGKMATEYEDLYLLFSGNFIKGQGSLYWSSGYGICYIQKFSRHMLDGIIKLHHYCNTHGGKFNVRT